MGLFKGGGGGGGGGGGDVLRGVHGASYKAGQRHPVQQCCYHAWLSFFADSE